MQAKHRSDFLGAAQLELAQAAPFFDHAKHFRDAAAGIDRLGVALVASGAPITGPPKGLSCGPLRAWQHWVS